jgi:predicted Zn-dependent peptidase
MADAFASLATAPPTSEELASARRTLEARLESRPVEQWLRDIEVYSLPRNYPLMLRSKLASVTSSELQSLARKLSDANALTTVILGRKTTDSNGRASMSTDPMIEGGPSPEFNAAGKERAVRSMFAEIALEL